MAQRCRAAGAAYASRSLSSCHCGAGTVTPAGHWNQIAIQLAAAQGNSLSANARLFDPGFSPTTTSTPYSFRLSACAWPWLP